MSTRTRRFGAYVLDLDTGELKRGREAIPLERQPARVLVALVGRAGQLVPRADLQKAVWPDGVHVDFERGLNYCIRQLRAVLQDDVRRPAFIQTVPRQGYRFVAEVYCSSDTDAPAVPAPREQRPSFRPVWPTSAAAALALAWVFVYSPLSPEDPRSPGRNAAHHNAAVTAARNVHEILIGPATSNNAHHRLAVETARLVHNLMFDSRP
jgi:DNA-binding winged helix-turn-helix (wHTH) protein